VNLLAADKSSRALNAGIIVAIDAHQLDFDLVILFIMSLLPTAALVQTTSLINHLTTTPVHAYFPYARFPVLHAVRVAVVWATLTRGKRGRGYLQDLFGYLVMACT
jgi:hypothetical protein